MAAENTNGPSLLDSVLRFFEEDQWNYQKLENKPVVRAGYRGDHGTWVCYARVDEEQKLFVFHSLTGMNIAPQYRLTVSEYLTRVNFLLSVGCFDMDWNTGDIRFRTSAVCPDGQLTVKMVRSLVYINTQTMDHYFPAVVAIVHGGLSPELALSRIESLPILSPQPQVEVTRQ